MSESEGYRIIQQLGTGLSGVTYLSESEGGKVAVRQFRGQSPPGTPGWTIERNHFLAGARASAGLLQPRIVQVREVIDEDGEAFVAMEYVPSPTLEAVLPTSSFTPQQANYLLRRMASTLDYAHQKGVVHGDLKPSNIFILTDQQIKLSDFLISPRCRRDRGPLPPLWAHPYLSPEHVSAPEAIGFRSDQYSLAAIAYHFYTGQPPYMGAGEALTFAIATGNPAPPSSLRATVPRACDEVFLKALARNPQQRYASNGEFMDALESRAPYVVAPVLLPVKKKIAPWMIYTLGALALLLAALFTPTSENKFRNARKNTSRPTETQTIAPPVKPVVPERPPEKPPVKTTQAIVPRQPDSPVPGGGTVTTPPPRRQDPPVPPSRTTPDVVPPVRHPAPPQPPVNPLPSPTEILTPNQADALDMAVFSRTHKIEPGLSFAYRDATLGELGQGDLKVKVQANGPAPKGKLTIEWVVDGVRMAVQPIVVNQMLEYNNEPTAGMYRVTLWLDGKKPLRIFTFRISP